MASTLTICNILAFLAIACLATPVFCQLCQDLDTNGCKLLIASKPDFCTTSPLANTACQRTCGNCPLTCYHCPLKPVNDSITCTTTKHCASSEMCMINTLYAHDGHIEHILSCIDRSVCDGAGFGFNSNLVGKRHQRRNLNLHCCHTDLCNVPDFTTTTQRAQVSSVTPPGFYSCHSDIVFVVDESGSVGFAGFKKVISFITDIVGHLDVGTHGDQLSLLLFDNDPHLQWYLNDYTTKADLLNALTYVPYHNGTTNTGSALKYVRENVFQFKNGDRPTAKNVVVVITDGRSNNHTATVVESNNLRRDGVRMVDLGVGNAVNSELIDIAGVYANAAKVAGYDHLPEAESKILKLIC
ncbi:collagen alpha-1(XIV) chain-like isoform X2 [Mercenaria mercenaria]|uniref:collagen alpha-1(XIV) chain-like isoform X2 n=1 Tax=Mercenaria mercenaria TaxID=6596 RepID=UPI00234F3F10|nr:collagen alpha-1(XIV) chain-like isoform X2 [Mercenaria mercenaria]